MSREKAFPQVTQEEYEALYNLIIPRSPKELFEFMTERLVAFKLMRYRDVDPFRAHIPKNNRFILVPPVPKVLDLDLLMSCVEFAGVRGSNYIKIKAEIKNLVEYPWSAYLIADVDDGRGMLGKTPLATHEEIIRKKRIPYTIFSGVIHAILFPHFFATHNIWLTGSRHGDDSVADLWLSEGKPKLYWYWAYFSSAEWGSASCGRIIVP